MGKKCDISECSLVFGSRRSYLLGPDQKFFSPNKVSEECTQN